MGGRHAAPEGRHRRSGALLAQVGLVSVLALVAVSVLLGSNMARDTVGGTFAAAPESPSASASPPAAPSSGVDTPDGGASASTALSAPASRPASKSPAAPATSDTSQASVAVTPPPSSDRVAPPKSSITTTPKTSAVTTSSAAATSTEPPPEKFSSCDEAKAAGVSMIPTGDPRYALELDHDGDGVACDRHGDPPTRHRPTPDATATITPTTSPDATPSVCPAPGG